MSKPPAKKSTAARKSAGTTSRARATGSKADSSSKADDSVGASEAPRTSRNILSAGIKALANAHGEAVARQSRVFESLLGLGPHRDEKTAPGDKPAALDPFGFKKFEDVFDQRVARTLQRLGVPSAQAFADLTAEVERLRAELAHMKAPGKKR